MRKSSDASGPGWRAEQDRTHPSSSIRPPSSSPSCPTHAPGTGNPFAAASRARPTMVARSKTSERAESTVPHVVSATAAAESQKSAAKHQPASGPRGIIGASIKDSDNPCSLLFHHPSIERSWMLRHAPPLPCHRPSFRADPRHEFGGAGRWAVTERSTG
jgi:hypothetical protein